MKQILPWQNMIGSHRAVPAINSADPVKANASDQKPCAFTACSIGKTGNERWKTIKNGLYEIASMRLFARLIPG
jgi:hypothetical protein